MVTLNRKTRATAGALATASDRCLFICPPAPSKEAAAWPRSPILYRKSGAQCAELPSGLANRRAQPLPGPRGRPEYRRPCAQKADRGRPKMAPAHRPRADRRRLDFSSTEALRFHRGRRSSSRSDPFATESRRGSWPPTGLFSWVAHTHQRHPTSWPKSAASVRCCRVAGHRRSTPLSRPPYQRLRRFESCRRQTPRPQPWR